MKASELIAELQKLMKETGTDPEVGAQSHGCCTHAHEILSVEMGEANDEIGQIVIRV